MVEIECLACGKPIKMPKYIDPKQYDGQVVCQECESLLHVKLAKGKVQKYAIVEKKVRPVTIKFVPAEKQLREEGDIVKDTDKENSP